MSKSNGNKLNQFGQAPGRNIEEITLVVLPGKTEHELVHAPAPLHTRHGVRGHSLSHPSLGWLYVFSSFPPPRPRPRPRPPQWLLLLTSKPFELHLRYLGQGKCRSGKMYWMTFRWPWLKVTAVTLINKNLLVCRTKWEPLNQSLQNLVAISPGHGYHLIRFWRNSVGNPNFAKFSYKISEVFFQDQTLYWTYLMNGWCDWCETKRMCIGWILGKLFDLDLPPDLSPWPSSFKVKVWNSLIWGMGGLTWNERDVRRSFMTMPVTYG